MGLCLPGVMGHGGEQTATGCLNRKRGHVVPVRSHRAPQQQAERSTHWPHFTWEQDVPNTQCEHDSGSPDYTSYTRKQGTAQPIPTASDRGHVAGWSGARYASALGGAVGLAHRGFLVHFSGQQFLIQVRVGQVNSNLARFGQNFASWWLSPSLWPWPLPLGWSTRAWTRPSRT